MAHKKFIKEDDQEKMRLIKDWRVVVIFDFSSPRFSIYPHKVSVILHIVWQLSSLFPSYSWAGVVWGRCSTEEQHYDGETAFWRIRIRWRFFVQLKEGGSLHKIKCKASGSPQFGIPQFGGEITDLPQWRNRLAHGTYRQYTVEQCRGCEFEPHLGKEKYFCLLYF